jgi:hypothetical protein
MTQYVVSIKDRSGNFQQYYVPEEVYTYVKQMEAYIMYPEASKFLEMNPHLDLNIKQYISKDNKPVDLSNNQ